jgi:hypothetical protein
VIRHRQLTVVLPERRVEVVLAGEAPWPAERGLLVLAAEGEGRVEEEEEGGRCKYGVRKVCEMTITNRLRPSSLARLTGRRACRTYTLLMAKWVHQAKAASSCSYPLRRCMRVGIRR